MGKNCWNSGNDLNNYTKILVGSLFLLSFILGIRAFSDIKLLEEYELKRNPVGEGSYEQQLIAVLEDGREISIDITVEEKSFTQAEAKEELKKAKKMLEKILRGDNESFENVNTDLNFTETVDGTMVEVLWTDLPLEYFERDGTLRKEVEVWEPVELEIGAILSCQEITEDFHQVVCLLPKPVDPHEQIKRLVEECMDFTESDKVILPKTYEGQLLRWRRPLDITFLWFLFLGVSALLFLRVGRVQDVHREKQKRLEEIERSYPQVVSKFAMLLAAGFSVRNAWERIVRLNEKNGNSQGIVAVEMNRSFLEMQKGISELEVYEHFGARIGEIHYKKMMALFISDRVRGSVPLLESMNQEMFQAWEERKRKIRQQGEKIGTKLLIPMMGMLLVVFLIILVPAFLSFQI